MYQGLIHRDIHMWERNVNQCNIYRALGGAAQEGDSHIPPHGRLATYYTN